jgi:hypothetical protein
VFCGRLIEAITIICTSVGREAFKPVADQVIQVLLLFQNASSQSKDDARVYLINAWERICLLMRHGFSPYLQHVMPGIFKMAALMPTMGI